MALNRPISKAFEYPFRLKSSAKRAEFLDLANNDPALKKRLLSALKDNNFEAFHSAVKISYNENVHLFLALTNDDPELQEKMLKSHFFVFKFLSNTSGIVLKDKIRFDSVDSVSRARLPTLKIIIEAANKYPRLQTKLLERHFFERIYDNRNLNLNLNAPKHVIFFESALSKNDHQLNTHLLTWAKEYSTRNMRIKGGQLYSKILNSIAQIKNYEVTTEVFKVIKEHHLNESAPLHPLDPRQLLLPSTDNEDILFTSSQLRSAFKANNALFVELFFKELATSASNIGRSGGMLSRVLFRNDHIYNNKYDFDRKTIAQIFESVKKYQPESFLSEILLNPDISIFRHALSGGKPEVVILALKEIEALGSQGIQSANNFLLENLNDPRSSLKSKRISLLIAIQKFPFAEQDLLTRHVRTLHLAPAIDEMNKLLQRGISMEHALMAVSTTLLQDPAEVAINLLALPEEIYQEYYDAASARLEWETANEHSPDFPTKLSEVRCVKRNIIAEQTSAGKTIQESEAYATNAAQDLLTDLLTPNFIENQAKIYRRSELSTQLVFCKNNQKMPLEMVREIASFSAETESRHKEVQAYILKEVYSFQKNEHPDSNRTLYAASERIRKEKESGKESGEGDGKPSATEVRSGTAESVTTTNPLNLNR